VVLQRVARKVFRDEGGRQEYSFLAQWDGIEDEGVQAVSEQELPGVVQAGKEITSEELDLIRATVELFPNLSRSEVAFTVCEQLGWMTASGSYKLTACLGLLERLEKLGMVSLPTKVKRRTVAGHDRPRWTSRSEPGEQIVGTIGEVGPVWLAIAGGGEEGQLWKEYVDRYHYLGYHRPFGCVLRYFAFCDSGLLGCVLLSGAAKQITVRDRWIGWTSRQRERNLPWVVNNSRFLVLPWVNVRHLASHVLGHVTRRIADDWEERWGYRPLLLETFVDQERFQGTCYRAAGWEYLGQTTGEGLARPGREYKTTPKMILVRPLANDFRARLSSDSLMGLDQ
jgi:hypothetical protein